jgi:hypothetical protein
MTRSRLALPVRAALALAMALGVAVQAPRPAEAQPQGTQGGDSARARELFQKGREEYGKGRLPEAYALFVDAWRLQKSFDVAANLALVEKQLARHREAAEHAAYAQANLPLGASDAQRRTVEETLSSARSFVGTVTLKVSVDHAAVTVDGQPAGESPFAFDIFVEPGPHTFVATVTGCEAVKDSVHADRGSTHLLTLTFTKCGEKGPPQLPPPIVVPPAGPRPLTIAGVAVTGVGFVMGTAFAILSKIKADDADQQLQTIERETSNNPNACAAGSAHATECNTLYDLRRSHDTFANAAIGTFVAAGAVGVGTLIYVFAVPAAPVPQKAGQALVIPVVGPGAGGLMVKGVF